MVPYSWLVLVLIFSMIDDSYGNSRDFRIGLVLPENTSATLCPSLYTDDNIWPEDPNVKVTIVPFIIPDMSMISYYEEGIQHMKNLNLSAIIHSLDFSLSLLTNILNIPYFLLTYSKVIVPPHSIVVTTDFDQISMAIRDLVYSVNARASITFLVDNTINRLAYYILENFPTDEIEYVSLNVSEPRMEIRKKLISMSNASRSTINDMYVLMIPDGRMDRLEIIMEEAMYAGLGSSNELWIIPSLVVLPEYLRPFRRAYARIVALSLGNEGLLTQEQRMAKDCKVAVRHLIEKRLAQSSIMGSSEQQSLTFLSELQYVSPSNIANNTDSFDVVGVWKWNGTATTEFYIDRRISLKKIIVRVGVFPFPPYFLTLNDGTYGGYIVDVFKIIAIDMNIDVQWVFVPNNTIGRAHTTGSGDVDVPSGLIGMLSEGTVDVGGIPMLVTKELLPLFDVTTSIHLVGVSLLTYDYDRVDWMFFLKPFSILVWITWGVSFIILVISFFIQETISPNTTNSGRRHYTIGDISFLVFTSLIITKLKIIPRLFSTRVFVLLLWFASLILVSSYTANMVPFLIRREGYLIPSNFKALYEERSHRKWFWIKDQDIKRHIVESKDPYALKVVDYATKHWPTRMYEPTVNASIARLTNNNNDVLIASSMLVSFLTANNCKLTAGTQSMFMSETVLGMRKGWPLKQRFLETLSNMKENSDLQRIYELWKSGSKCDTKYTIIWQDIFSSFIFLAAGVIISIIIGVGEYCIKYCKPAVMTCWNIRLRSGKTYSARVKEVEKDGVFVQIGKGTYQQRHFVSTDNLSPNIIHKKPEQLDARKLGIKRKEFIELKYYGKNPVSGCARLVRVFPNVDSSTNNNKLKKFVAALKSKAKCRRR